MMRNRDLRPSLFLVSAMLLGNVAMASGQIRGVGQVIARVGAIEGRDEQVFGHVSGALVTAAGEIVVMDDQARQLRLFDARGEFLHAIGREGEGPEDFGAGSLALAMAQDGRVLVADSRNLRVTTVQVENKRLRIDGSARLPFPPLDVCALGARIFVLTTMGENLVREVNSKGEIVREFASRERPAGKLAAQLGDADHFLNHGRLDCDTATGSVVLAHTFHPVVRAFSEDGSERWRIELPDYRQQQFRRSRDGRCCQYLIPDPRSGTYHVAEDVAVDGMGRALVTLRESWAESHPDEYQLRVLHIPSGSEVGREDVRGVVRSAGNGSVAIGSMEPFPQVLVRGWAHR